MIGRFEPMGPDWAGPLAGGSSREGMDNDVGKEKLKLEDVGTLPDEGTRGTVR